MQHGPYEHIAAATSGPIATIEIRRGPNNFVDTDMVAEIAAALEHYDRTPEVRAIVLCAEGKHFCAGADFASRGPDGVARGPNPVGISTRKPNGSGAPASPSSRRCRGRPWARGWASGSWRFPRRLPGGAVRRDFTRLGFHPGFGLTVTLPRLIGDQQAALLMLPPAAASPGRTP